jgi:hypothetical protein
VTRQTEAVVALVLVAAASRGEPPQAPLPVVVMEDQFERRHDLAALRGDVVVLIYGDRKSAEANKALGEWLHVHFHPAARGRPPAEARQAPVRPVDGLPPGARSPDVRVIAVACVGKVPAVVRKVIQGQFRAASPDVAVWLDFEDQMRREFAFVPGVPNVAVFDPQGGYRHHAAGAPTQESAARLAEVVEAVRRQAAATSGAPRSVRP